MELELTTTDVEGRGTTSCANNELYKTISLLKYVGDFCETSPVVQLNLIWVMSCANEMLVGWESF